MSHLSPPDHQQPLLKKRRIRWWIFISIVAFPMGILLSVISLLLLGYTVRDYRGQRALQYELARLEQDGIPTTSADLDKRYRVATSDETTEDWQVILWTLESEDFEATTNGVPAFDVSLSFEPFEDDFNVSPSWEYAERSIDFVNEHAGLIEQCRTLAVQPIPVYLPIQFNSLATILDDVTGTRSVASLLQTDAQVAIYEQDQMRAFDDVVAMLELPKHSDAVPGLVPKMIAIGENRAAFKVLRKAIQLDLFSDQQLKQIDQILAKDSGGVGQWKNEILDDMSMNLEVFSKPSVNADLDPIIPIREFDEVYFIQTMRKASIIPTDDWLLFHHSVGQLETELSERGKSIRGAFENSLSLRYLIPAFQFFAETLIDQAQLHRQARLAIALRIYEHRTGGFPPSLDEVGGDDQELRPYKAARFGYENSGDRVAIWPIHSAIQPETPVAPTGLSDSSVTSPMNRETIWILKD